MQRLTILVVAATAALSLSGCSILPGLHVDEVEGSSYQVVDISAATIADLRKSAEQLREADLGSTTPAVVPPEYRIGPGDVLTITVWEHPELTNPSGEFRDPVSAGRLVSSDGTIFYPYVGVLPVAGLTAIQVRQTVASKLSVTIRNPQVDVRVAAFRAQRVQVTGEVRQPGLVTLDDTPKGVLEVINERGGLTETSSRRRVTLIRRGKTYPIHLSRLVSGDRPAANPPVVAGDIIHVPDLSGDQIYVLGEVAKPGLSTMHQDRTTLTEVLAVSGGLDNLRADDGGVLVFRRTDRERGEPLVFRLDLSRPEGLLLAGEFELKSRDVVYVKATGFARYNSVINQLLPTISAVFQLDSLVNAR